MSLAVEIRCIDVNLCEKSFIGQVSFVGKRLVDLEGVCFEDVFQLNAQKNENTTTMRTCLLPHKSARPGEEFRICKSVRRTQKYSRKVVNGFINQKLPIQIGPSTMNGYM